MVLENFKILVMAFVVLGIGRTIAGKECGSLMFN